jgi:ATP-dependent protease ClpP protease subunit
MSSPMNQTISLVSGEIVVDAGSMGTIILKAGNSYITIEQSRIMISAPTVSINGTPVTIN